MLETGRDMTVAPKPISAPSSEATYSRGLTRLAGWWASWSGALGMAFVLICSIPLLTYGYVIATTGGNNLGNDYMGIIVMADKVLAGTYDWRNFLADTFNAQHWCTACDFVHLLIAKYFYWDARLELYVGLAIAAMTLIFLFSILREPADGKLRYVLVGGLLALVFSLSQASNLLFGIGTLSGGLGLLGFTVGLWGITNCRNKSVGLAVMLAGGILSSSSWGNVPPCWLAYLVALVLFSYRRKRHYFIWLCGTIVGLSPYAYFFLVNSHPAAHQAVHQATHTAPAILLFNWSFVINCLGRPFATNIAYDVGARKASEFAGIFGLLAITASILCLYVQRRFTARAKASLVLVLYGLASALQLSMVRSWVMAWYTSYTIDFWIGLLGLSLALISSYLNRESENRIDTTGGATRIQPFLAKVAPALAVVNLGVLAIIYVSTNRTYDDKTIFLYARSPASESTVRNYRTAPTYCEGLVFQWVDGNPGALQGLCEPLLRHSVSSFAPQQQWSLQGDFPMHNVQLLQDDLARAARWIPSMDVDKVGSWRSYEHLNLYLPSPGKIVWTIDLPANIESAQLETAYAIGKTGQAGAQGDKTPITFDIACTSQSLTTDKSSGESQPITLSHVTLSENGRSVPAAIPLTKFRGSRLAITFSSSAPAGSHHVQAVFQYPHVDVKLKGKARSQTAAELEVRPSNTDRSPFFQHETESDYCFPKVAASSWQAGEFSFPRIEQSSLAKVMVATPSSSVASSGDLRIPIHNYSHLLVEMSAIPELKPRALRAFLKVNQGPLRLLTIPLLSDGALHRYTYDLKLLELPDSAVLNQISLSPASKSREPADKVIRVERVKLISKKN